MMRASRSKILGAASGCVITCVALVAQQAGAPAGMLPKKFSAPSTVISSPRALRHLLGLEDRAPANNQVTWRGGPDVFKAVAPAVVVIRTATAQGSGFIVDGNGLVVTNHHVIASGLTHDAAGGGSYAPVYTGKLNADGTMTMQPDPLKGYLLKADEDRDLALLRLSGPGVAALAHVSLSAVAPRPGQDCAILGHPSSGLLWSMRPGQVASVGQFPGDLVNVVMRKLAPSAAERDQVTQELKAVPSRRIVLTSARANHGDSGGPLVDEQGNVIGVTFGGPAEAEDATFTYHVHLDELKAFLANVPAQPQFLRPDPWALGSHVELRDLDGDRRADALLAGEENPDTFLIDVTNATPAALAVRSAIGQLVSSRKWHFNLGFSIADGEVATFYDTDDDGAVDLILTGGARDRTATGRFIRDAAGRWQYGAAPAGTTLLSGTYLKDRTIAARADQLIKALSK
jgi:S1-C subfamily serine protease